MLVAPDTEMIQVSWAQVDEWEAQMESLRRKVEAAKVLLPAREKSRVGAKANVLAHQDIKPSNLMGTVVEIANNVLTPISRNELRVALREKGFAQEQLGPNLSVVLYKTAKAKRITYNGGMISGAPK